MRFPCSSTGPGKSVCLALKVNVAGIGQRVVIIEVALVLVSEAETVGAVKPGKVILINPASIRTDIGEADAHACDAVALKRGSRPIELDDREHRARQILQSDRRGEVGVDRGRIRPVLVQKAVEAGGRAIDDPWA